MKTGPTGRERIIYGLHETYDTTRVAQAMRRACAREGAPSLSSDLGPC